jgi:hypothetical protein
MVFGEILGSRTFGYPEIRPTFKHKLRRYGFKGAFWGRGPEGLLGCVSKGLASDSIAQLISHSAVWVQVAPFKLE